MENRAKSEPSRAGTGNGYPMLQQPLSLGEHLIGPRKVSGWVKIWGCTLNCDDLLTEALRDFIH